MELKLTVESAAVTAGARGGAGEASNDCGSDSAYGNSQNVAFGEDTDMIAITVPSNMLRRTETSSLPPSAPSVSLNDLNDAFFGIGCADQAHRRQVECVNVCR